MTSLADLIGHMIELPRIHERRRNPYAVRTNRSVSGGFRAGINVGDGHVLVRCMRAQCADDALAHLEEELIECVAEIRSKRLELRLGAAKENA